MRYRATKPPRLYPVTEKRVILSFIFEFFHSLRDLLFIKIRDEQHSGLSRMMTRRWVREYWVGGEAGEGSGEVVLSQLRSAYARTMLAGLRPWPLAVPHPAVCE
jgi:uncharacterized protein (UPF0332 family)